MEGFKSYCCSCDMSSQEKKSGAQYLKYRFSVGEAFWCLVWNGLQPDMYAYGMEVIIRMCYDDTLHPNYEVLMVQRQLTVATV